MDLRKLFRKILYMSTKALAAWSMHVIFFLIMKQVILSLHANHRTSATAWNCWTSNPLAPILMKLTLLFAKKDVTSLGVIFNTHERPSLCQFLFHHIIQDNTADTVPTGGPTHPMCLLTWNYQMILILYA